MNELFNDTMQGLLEVLEIEKGNIQMVERKGMPASSFVSAEVEKELIDETIKIRKENKISQEQLANLTGNKQQAISRIEKKEHSPSLKLFINIVHALGYEIKLVKKENIE